MSTRQMDYAVGSDPLPHETSEARPYPPSLVDRFMDAVERLPVPYGVTYLALFALQSLAMHVIAWADGSLAPFTFRPILLLFPWWLWAPLAMVTYLDSVALQALSGFSPLLDLQPEAMRRLKYEFTTLPARSVIASGVFWSVVYVIFNYLAFHTAYGSDQFRPALIVTTVIAGWISFLIGSIIYYGSLRQLRLVQRTVRMVKQVDLFQLDPVYAFSVLTSRTGVAWVILLSVTVLLVPVEIAFVPMLSMLVLQVVLALAAFVLPLRVVNLRLVAEKRRLAGAVDQRLKTTLARLHRCLDDNDLSEVDALSSAVTGLSAERDILARIPTWPWRPGLLTGFLSIVVLPIVLFLIQLALGKWLGG